MSKSVNYRKLHADVSSQWRFNYQRRHNKMHEEEVEHLKVMTQWYGETTKNLDETQKRLEECDRECHEKKMAILMETKIPNDMPKAPVDPWGAYYQYPNHDNPDEPKKINWKQEYLCFKGAMERVDECTITKDSMKSEIEASKAAEKIHFESRKRVCKNLWEPKALEFCVDKWQKVTD